MTDNIQTGGWRRLVPRVERPDYMPATYSDSLLHAWELKYGGSEEARGKGRELLGKLCQDKHHLNTNKKM